MKTLYESIIDTDEKIIKDTKVFSMDMGLFIKLLIDTFDYILSWDAMGVKYIEPRWRLKGGEKFMFGVNFTAWHKCREQFMKILKDVGFKFVRDEKLGTSHVAAIEVKGPKKRKITISFLEFNDYTYISVDADEADQKEILDLFERYKKMKS
jgi:hypothetical protein